MTNADDTAAAVAEAPPPSDDNPVDAVLPAPPTVREPDERGEPLNDIAAHAEDENERPSIVPNPNDIVCAKWKYTSSQIGNIDLNNHIIPIQAAYKAIHSYDYKGKAAFVGGIVGLFEGEGRRFIALDVNTGRYSLASDKVKRETVKRRLRRKKKGKIRVPPISKERLSSRKGASKKKGGRKGAATNSGRKSPKPRTMKKGTKPRQQSKAFASSGAKRRPAESTSNRRAKAPRSTPASTPRRPSTTSRGGTSTKGTSSRRKENTTPRRTAGTARKRPAEGNTHEASVASPDPSEGHSSSVSKSRADATSPVLAAIATEASKAEKSGTTAAKETAAREASRKDSSNADKARTLNPADIQAMSLLATSRETRASKKLRANPESSIPASGALSARVSNGQQKMVEEETDDVMAKEKNNDVKVKEEPDWYDYKTDDDDGSLAPEPMVTPPSPVYSSFDMTGDAPSAKVKEEACACANVKVNFKKEEDFGYETDENAELP